jgi:hypothetical protein
VLAVEACVDQALQQTRLQTIAQATAMAMATATGSVELLGALLVFQAVEMAVGTECVAAEVYDAQVK